MSSFKIGLLGESGRASQEHLEHMFSTHSSAVHEDTPSQHYSVGTPAGPEDPERNRRCENAHSGASPRGSSVGMVSLASLSCRPVR